MNTADAIRHRTVNGHNRRWFSNSTDGASHALAGVDSCYTCAPCRFHRHDGSQPDSIELNPVKQRFSRCSSSRFLLAIQEASQMESSDFMGWDPYGTCI